MSKKQITLIAVAASVTAVFLVTFCYSLYKIYDLQRSQILIAQKVAEVVNIQNQVVEFLTKASEQSQEKKP